MSRVGTPFVRVGLVAGALLLGGSLAACEEDSNAPGGGSFDAGGFDAGGFDGGSIDAAGATDGNQADVAAEAATPSTEPGIALANLRGAGIDFCFMPLGATEWTGPVFGSEGGVPDRSVSVRRPVPVGSQVAFIQAGASCTATPLFTPGTETTIATPIVTVVVRGGPDGDARKVFYKPAEHTAGKEMVYFGPFSRDAAFHPAGGGPSTEIERGEPTALEPNVTGELLLTASGNPTFTRPMKTAAGIVFLLETPTDAILCDELPPYNGHLLRCGSDVRAP
jgi:hypothetical protein